MGVENEFVRSFAFSRTSDVGARRRQFHEIEAQQDLSRNCVRVGELLDLLPRVLSIHCACWHAAGFAAVVGHVAIISTIQRLTVPQPRVPLFRS